MAQLQKDVLSLLAAVAEHVKAQFEQHLSDVLLAAFGVIGTHVARQRRHCSALVITAVAGNGFEGDISSRVRCVHDIAKIGAAAARTRARSRSLSERVPDTPSRGRQQGGLPVGSENAHGRTCARYAARCSLLPEELAQCRRAQM